MTESVFIDNTLTIPLLPSPAYWACVQSKACSRRCVVNYMKRYGGPRPYSCEQYALTHMGGKWGRRSRRARNYWLKVKACMEEWGRVLNCPRENCIDIDNKQIIPSVQYDKMLPCLTFWVLFNKVSDANTLIWSFLIGTIMHQLLKVARSDEI